VADDRDRLLEAGGAALHEGDWAAAREAFAAIVDLEPGHPAALSGLGSADWWLGAVPEAMASWEEAYGAWVHAGDHVQAVQTAVQLTCSTTPTSATGQHPGGKRPTWAWPTPASSCGTSPTCDRAVSTTP
jgi:hypothetical protein